MVCTQDTPAGVLLRRGRPKARMGNTTFYVRRQSFSFRREGFSCGPCRNRPGGTKDKLLFAYVKIAEDDWRIVAYCMYNNESRIRRIQGLPPLARAPNQRW